MPTVAVVLAVLLNPDHLLRLPVGHAQLHERGRLARGGDGGAAAVGLGRCQHDEVAQDDAADDGVVTAARLTGVLDAPAGDDVDVVARLERACKQLMLITFDLVRTLRALDLCTDALLLRRSEAPR